MSSMFTTNSYQRGTSSGAVGSDFVVNVKTYGAFGDGTVDDSAACQAAADAVTAAGGGELVFPDGGNYYIRTGIDLGANTVVVAHGATLLKKAGDPDYFIFRAGSKGQPDGPSGLKLYGGTIQGSFSGSIGASITLNKARNVLISGVTFSQCVISGHAIDLGGCRNVVIEECTFEGFHLAASTVKFTEAVQVDFAYAAGNSVDAGYPGSYDGEPCEDITVRECRFLPLTIGATTYPAPNPFGSHARIQSRKHRHLRFIGNVVKDCRATTGFTADTMEEYCRGWIHFASHADELTIEGNAFLNSDGRAAMVIQTVGHSKGVLLADTDDPNAPSTSDITPLPIKGWRVVGNTFQGFSTTVNTEHLVYLTGHYAAPTLARELTIADNYVVDSSPTTSGDGANTGSEFLNVQYAGGVVISGNRIDATRIAFEVYQSERVTLTRNIVRRASWKVAQLYDNVAITITDNTASEHCGGFHLTNSTGVGIHGNQASILSGVTTKGIDSQVALSGCTSVLVSRNILQGPITRGIYAYSATQRLRVESNIVLGATTGVDLTSGTLVDCAQSGNVTA